MSSYKFDSIVNRQEADALKEMIFKRARERAESMTKESQESYTSAVRNDIMDLARDTFVSNKNPFSAAVEPKVEEKAEMPVKKDVEVGFSQRKIEEVKAQINYRNRVSSDEIANNEIEETMTEARAEFSNKTSFMGALNFLNSQASITLVNKRGKKFEALA
ncbi:MAG: hypothetical protein NC408_03670 [Candidatus Gastranaerophilales bacterium]|nr:hypothetical protein [Candidatus Gastranaerophilales bacterium]MCM1073954.1 hypothetical protein [Bacteroides sp.]